MRHLDVAASASRAVCVGAQRVVHVKFAAPSRPTSSGEVGVAAGAGAGAGHPRIRAPRRGFAPLGRISQGGGGRRRRAPPTELFWALPHGFPCHLVEKVVFPRLVVEMPRPPALLHARHVSGLFRVMSGRVVIVCL